MMDFPRCWIVPLALKPPLARSGCFFRDKSASVVFESAEGTAALRVCAGPEVRPVSARYLQILYNLFRMAEKGENS